MIDELQSVILGLTDNKLSLHLDKMEICYLNQNQGSGASVNVIL
jgi:hypothetical protein